ncbi:NACHT domain-containing protein [Lentzea albida]|uniref:NACHT domain-containing protein n=1 Tax=Lentzea albida TaxID=65499 RepID=A0A1H9M3Q9_9PSEU|nr:hypothetical protein [Lentzea albida]SER18316.1 hypothetical protein SAMN04488000_106413 [Lentzea albida]
MTEPGKSRRKLLGTTRNLVLLAIVGLAVTAVLFKWQDGNAALGIVAGLVTIVTFFLLVIDRVRAQTSPPQVDAAVKDLQMRLLEQWEPEVQRRIQHSPHSQTIPLEWKERSRSGTDSSQLDGRFDGDSDEAATQLADAFQRLPGKHRMVVLGEPGSGKTFLALALTVGLLRRWTEGEPVAVFLTLSSWDPVVETLDEWTVGTIASAYYGGDQRIPKALLTARRLIPVLDGLDELPEHLRRLAVRRINDAITGVRPVVVTCRTADYEEVVAGGSPELLRVPAVEVQPVATPDLVNQLRDVPAWQEVVAHVKEHPKGHVADALRTPLMLSFFTAVYEYRDPAELIDQTKFSSKHAVEDHLVDLRLNTAYPEEPLSGQWSAEQGKNWLTYLARHMHDHDERSVTWWQVAFRNVEGGHLLVALALVVALWLSEAAFLSNTVAKLLKLEPLFILVFGTVMASVWLASRRQVPGRRQPVRNSRSRGFKRGLVIGTVAVLLPGLFLISLSIVTASEGFRDVMETSSEACAILALALAHGVVVGLHEMMVEWSTAKHTAHAARELLRRERVSTFVAAVIAGLVIGPLSIVITTTSMSYGTHLGQWFASTLDFPTVFRPEPPASSLNWDLLVKGGALITVLSALMLASSRSWPRLLAAKVKLACTRKLPWRLGRFVTDATQRGLLRRSGVAYEFGHILLQERLVSTAVNYPPLHHRPWLRRTLAGSVALMVVVAATAAWSGRPEACDSAKRIWIGSPMIRVEKDRNTGCFHYVPENKWETLAQGTDSAPALADIRARLPKMAGTGTPSHGPVLIIGEFDEIRSAKRHEVFTGVAAAQQVTEGSLEIGFIYADLEDSEGKEAAALIDLYIEDIWLTGEITRNTYRSVAAVGLDLDWSRPDASLKIVGLNDMELREHATERRNVVTRAFLDKSPARSTLPSCEEVGEARSTRSVLDLRSAHPTGPMLDELARCGTAEVMVEQSDAMKLSLLPGRPSEVKIHYLSDRSSTITRDCLQASKTQDADSASVKACVAVVAANESFRVSVEELPPPVTS